MAKKTLGYMELEWTCPNCQTKNPGMQKTCTSCGSPQPENVQFGIGEQQELLSDQQKVTQAQKGADFHCPYCGTRNMADASTCSQCGGDLTGAVQRASGKVIAGAGTAPQAGSAARAASPAPQTATQPKIQPWIVTVAAIIGVLGLCVCAVVLGYLFFSTEKVTGTVQNVSWQCTVPIQELRDVTHQDWRDEIPSGARDLSCDLKYRTRQDSPAANATEVCSTQLVDKGNGAAEVVEECYYEVYDDYCTYTVEEWTQVDQAIADGDDLNPSCPDVNLKAGQREGERKQTYKAQFDSEKGLKEYTTDNETLFRQFKLGSTWTLDINPLGAIVNLQP
jgi:hypothetical protein